MRKKREDSRALGDQIKLERERAGLTQERFAELLEVSTTYVSNLERGKIGLSIDTLRRLCEILCVSADKILFLQEKNDVTYIQEKLENVDQEYLEILEDIVNKYLELIAIKK